MPLVWIASYPHGTRRRRGTDRKYFRLALAKEPWLLTLLRAAGGQELAAHISQAFGRAVERASRRSGFQVCALIKVRAGTAVANVCERRNRE